MAYKRILTIQDISCVGQCSLTVALPVLSALGLETCVLPTAVLSTHTGGEFSGYSFRDLTEDMPAIAEHWQRADIDFDGIYTGYLGNKSQVEHVKHIAESLLKKGGKLVVDPVMGDNGQLYSGFDQAFVEEIKKLCGMADILIPNLTEACLLTGQPYREDYDQGYIEEILKALQGLGAKGVVITGVSYNDRETGAALLDGDKYFYYSHPKYDRIFHGTGDLFASTFAGTWLSGGTLEEALVKAADFVLASIEETMDDPEHWYGVRFEKVLGKLIK